jgi:hypothetical protein
MDSLLEQIRAIPLREYIESWGHTVGRNNKCPCPICGSGGGPNKTPAFHVYERRYHCYSCGFSGDIIDLNMQVHDLSFVDATNRVAGEWGIGVVDQPKKPRLMIQVGTKPVVGSNDEIETAPTFKNYRMALANPCYLTPSDEEFLFKALDEFTESELKDMQNNYQRRRDWPSHNMAGGIALREAVRGHILDERVVAADELLRATHSIFATAPSYDWLCLATRYFRRD